ncbi:MAG: transposase [Ferruginibacter sp.]
MQTAGIPVEKQIKKAALKKWNVYTKSLIGNVAAEIKYLGTYTHKVAITPALWIYAKPGKNLQAECGTKANEPITPSTESGHTS